MPFKIFFSAVLALTSLTVHAQTVVEDPQHLLNRVDAFLGLQGTSFESQFGCGDTATFDHAVTSCEFGCSEWGCYTSCQSEDGRMATHQVGACTSSQISIFSDDAENMDFSREEYVAMNGNVSRKFLSTLSNLILASGKVVLTDVKPVTYKFNPNDSNSPSFSALNLTGTFVLEGFEDGPEVLLTILKDVPGVAQIARFRIGGNTWFRMNHYQKAGSP